MPCCLLQAMYSVHVYIHVYIHVYNVQGTGWLARRQGAGYGSDSQSLLPTHAMQPHLRPYLATTSTSFKWALREALPAIVSSTTCTSAASPVLLSLETDHGIIGLRQRAARPESSVLAPSFRLSHPPDAFRITHIPLWHDFTSLPCDRGALTCHRSSNTYIASTKLV